MKSSKKMLLLTSLFLLGGCGSQQQVDQVTSQPSQETLELGQQNSDIQSPKSYLTRTELEDDFEPVFFMFDSANLTYDAQRKVQRMAESIKLNQTEAYIRINGYTDPIGAEKYNYLLGKARGISVRNHLIELGVNPDRLKVISYGEAKTDSSSQSSHRDLRRVELSFSVPVLKTEVQKISSN